MNPARQMSSTPSCLSIRSISASWAALLGNALRWTTKVLILADAATPRPAASGLSLMTQAISAGKSLSAAARIKAVMLDPRPEIRIAVFFLGLIDQDSPGKRRQH